MKKTIVLVMLLLVMSVMAFQARAVPTPRPPSLVISLGMPTAQTFDTQTITVISFAGNASGNFTPSRGPVSIQIIDPQQQPVQGYGCDACLLTNGTTTIFLPIGENLRTGWATVRVHDAHTNLSAQAQFQIVIAPSYLLFLFRRGLQDMNETMQTRVNAIMNQATFDLEIGFVSLVLGFVVALLATQHRIARAKRYMSTVDWIRYKLHWHSPTDPSGDQLYDKHYSSAPYLINDLERDSMRLEVERSMDKEQRYIRELRTAIGRQRSRIMRKLSRLQKSNTDLEDKFIRDRIGRLREQRGIRERQLLVLNKREDELEAERSRHGIPSRDPIEELDSAIQAYGDVPLDEPERTADS